MGAWRHVLVLRVWSRGFRPAVLLVVFVVVGGAVALSSGSGGHRSSHGLAALREADAASHPSRHARSGAVARRPGSVARAVGVRSRSIRPRARRGVARGVFGASGSSGSASGPVVGARRHGLRVGSLRVPTAVVRAMRASLAKPAMPPGLRLAARYHGRKGATGMMASVRRAPVALGGWGCGGSGRCGAAHGSRTAAGVEHACRVRAAGLVRARV